MNFWSIQLPGIITACYSEWDDVTVHFSQPILTPLWCHQEKVRGMYINEHTVSQRTFKKPLKRVFSTSLNIQKNLWTASAQATIISHSWSEIRCTFWNRFTIRKFADQMLGISHRCLLTVKHIYLDAKAHYSSIDWKKWQFFSSSCYLELWEENCFWICNALHGSRATSDKEQKGQVEQKHSKEGGF